jgi:hypothetical protein
VEELPLFPLGEQEKTVSFMRDRDKPRFAILMKKAEVLREIGLAPAEQMVRRSLQYLRAPGL